MKLQHHFFTLIPLLLTVSSMGCPGDQICVTPQAHVRTNNGISSHELQVLLQRRIVNQAALERFSGTTIGQRNVPLIGALCSGGGMRAAIATMGLLCGLEKIGLLDAVTYLTTLSGSTWTASAWLHHQHPLPILRNYLKNRFTSLFSSNYLHVSAIVQALTNKRNAGHSLSLNDLYGALIANTFLADTTTTGNSGQSVQLSDFTAPLRSGMYPIPLFTSIIGETYPNYIWLEYSPFEVGSTELETWIPAHAIGKKFDGGISFDAGQVEQLSFLLGAFGSIYAGNAVDLVLAMKETVEADFDVSISSSWFDWLPGGNTRFLPPTIPNFTYKLPHCQLSKLERLTLVDAGLAINLPFPPLLRRNICLYIVCDASSDADSATGGAMRKAETYARFHDLPFPHIDYGILPLEDLSVWADPKDPLVPVIIFIPNHVPFSTFKFSYTPDEFEALCSGIERAVVDNVDQVRAAVMLAIKNATSRGRV